LVQYEVAHVNHIFFQLLKNLKLALANRKGGVRGKKSDFSIQECLL
jgi:hypothetical protein